MSFGAARRVPWATSAEFSAVFELLFCSSHPDADPVPNQRNALSHLYAWAIRSPSSFPPAVESTHALLSLLLPPAPSPHHQRLGLAMALTRMVNSLVDPLQKGLYARSVSQIANELGLPLAFVQLRHRATHEDLPGHAVLLESATLALDWLYTHYWLPTMNDLEGTGQLKQSTIASLESLLGRYKRARKRAMVDATEAEHVQIQQQIDQWIRLAARELSGDGSRNRDAEDKSGCELRPLGVLCSSMCEAEMLVPRSAKKRCRSLNEALPEPLMSLYDPLIDHLSQSYPLLFIRSIILALIDMLEASAEEQRSGSPMEPSYCYTCAAWVVHLLKRPDGEAAGEEILRRLLSKPNAYALSIIRMLKQSDRPDWLVDDEVAPLEAVLQRASAGGQAALGDAKDRLANMRQRWQELTASGEESVVEGFKWRLVPEDEWAPCPIGCLPGGVVPDLYQALS